MNAQPDKFFRDKLYNYERPVSPGTWKRITEHQRRGTQVRWMGIAAAIVLLAIAGIVLSPWETSESPAVMAGNSGTENTNSAQNDSLRPTKLHEPSVETTDMADSAPSPALEEHVSQSVANQRKQTTRTRIVKGDPKSVYGKETVAALAAMEAEAIDENAEDNQPDLSSATPRHSQERKTITIVFNAEEVNEKYLRKSAVAEATPQVKETSTFKKLLDKAYDLKHNQDPLGELRQKKNEIFALNFRDNKTRVKN